MFRFLFPMTFLGNVGKKAFLQRAAFVTSASFNNLSSFQLKKITQEFDHIYDRNNDGFVDKKDIEAFKKKLRDYKAGSGGLSQNSYKLGYEDYWKLFQDLADTNKDGRLSREEWVELWTIINAEAKDTSFASLPQWIRMMPGSIFPVIDSKGDGVIDEEEYRNFWYAVAGYSCKDYKSLLSLFAVLTENGKYKLDLKRFEDLYADFYLSDDPTSPGRYVAGPVEYH